MSDFDSTEQKLRRTFLAVAEQPVDEERTAAEAPRTGNHGSRFPRHLRVVSLAFVTVVLLTVGLVVAFGPLTSKTTGPASLGGSSAKSRLQQALNATFNASGYVSTSSADPTERTVVNAPNLTETIDNGLVTEIDVGNTNYIASWAFAQKLGYQFGPSHCGPHELFIKSTPQGSASGSYDLKGTDVVVSNDVFTVSRNGTTTESFVVRNGYVVQITMLFGTIGKTEVTSFSEIGHAPKILVPKPSEVVAFPKAFLRGCPLPNVP